MKLSLLISFLQTCLAVQLFAQYDPKAEEILNQMNKVHKNMGTYKAVFTYKIHSEVENIDETLQGSIVVKQNKYVLKIGDIQEIYNNGTTVWTYIKSKKANSKNKGEVTITNYEPDSEEFNLAEIFNLYKKGFKYYFMEEEKVDNELYDVVDLVPEDKTKDYFKIRLWIHKKTKELRNLQTFEKSGRRIILKITQFTANLNVGDNDFVFNKSKYPDTTEVDLR
jgi:outer membrane lipoprotein-sorting protein